MAFINRFNQQQAGETQIGWEYILPTEAQWEYARRAGSTSVWGNFDLSDGPYDLSTGDIYANAQTVLEFNGSLANYNAGAGSPFSHKDVGQYPPNSWGFHDMSGSASEWVADWLGSYSSDSQTDPQGPSIGTDRVIRGGSLENQRVHQTSSNRGGSPPEWKRYSTGFRLAYMYTNKVPSDLNATAPLTIAENQPIGTIVGEFNATDPDPPTSPQVIYSDGFEAGSLRSDWNASGVIGNAYAVVDSNKSLYGTKSLHLGIGTVTAPANSSEVMLHLPFGQTLHKGSVEMDLWVNEDANHSSFVYLEAGGQYSVGVSTNDYDDSFAEENWNTIASSNSLFTTDRWARLKWIVHGTQVELQIDGQTLATGSAHGSVTGLYIVVQSYLDDVETFVDRLTITDDLAPDPNATLTYSLLWMGTDRATIPFSVWMPMAPLKRPLPSITNPIPRHIPSVYKPRMNTTPPLKKFFGIPGDINEAPVFQQENPSFSVSENQTTIGNLFATDPEVKGIVELSVHSTMLFSLIRMEVSGEWVLIGTDQFGIGHYQEQSTPVKIIDGNVTITAVSTGASHSLFLKTDG